jgi:protein-S-isoprenylcysteine O-methyltransferase Ste14
VIGVNVAILVIHAVFWLSFALTALVLRLQRGNHRSVQPGPPVAAAVVAEREHIGPFSRTVIASHSLGFFLMYFGIDRALSAPVWPTWISGQRLIGTAVIVAGNALAIAALAHFHSWRIRARLADGHQLATAEPFRLIRHPIYLALDLLALGSAIWLPTTMLWVSVVVIGIAGDLRARSEEHLLEQAFGDAYLRYESTSKRFIPRIY